MQMIGLNALVNVKISIIGLILKLKNLNGKTLKNDPNGKN